MLWRVPELDLGGEYQPQTPIFKNVIRATRTGKIPVAKAKLFSTNWSLIKFYIINILSYGYAKHVSFIHYLYNFADIAANFLNINMQVDSTGTTMESLQQRFIKILVHITIVFRTSWIDKDITHLYSQATNY